MPERRIGPFKLDLDRPSLRSETEDVPVTGQSYRLLKRLSDSPGKALSHAELISAMWPEFNFHKASGTTRESYENRLRTAVNQLRKQLEPDEKSPRLYIGTVSAFGYRINDSVLVEEIPDPPGEGDHPLGPPPDEPISQDRLVLLNDVLPGDALPNDALPNDVLPSDVLLNDVLLNQSAESARQVDQRARKEHPGPRWRLWLSGVLLVMALGIVSIAAYLFRPRREALPLVLVLPVANHTNDAANDSMTEGFTDELITQLGVLGKAKLTVLPRATSILYRNKGFVLSELKKQVNADYVVEGFIRDDSVGLKVDINFFRTEDGTRLFGQSYPTDSKSMRGDVASMLASQVVLALRGLPPGASAPRPYFSPRQNGADEAFDRGKQELADDMPARAVSEFLTVIQLDPDYRDVYTNLALSYYQSAQQDAKGWNQAVQKGDAAIEEALFRAPLSSQAHAVRGFSRWLYHWNWSDAGHDFTYAIAQDDGNTDAHRWYGLALATSGKSAEAEEQMQQALRLLPDAPANILLEYGWVQYLSGHPDQAASTLERVLKVKPSSTSCNLRLWTVYSWSGRYAEALQRLCAVSSCDSPEKGLTSANLSGSHQYAAALREVSRTLQPSAALDALTRSEIAVYSQDNEGAVRALTDGCIKHDGSLIYALADPALAKLNLGTRRRPTDSAFCKG